MRGLKTACTMVTFKTTEAEFGSHMIARRGVPISGLSLAEHQSMAESAYNSSRIQSARAKAAILSRSCLPGWIFAARRTVCGKQYGQPKSGAVNSGYMMLKWKHIWSHRSRLRSPARQAWCDHGCEASSPVHSRVQELEVILWQCVGAWPHDKGAIYQILDLPGDLVILRV
jgi:hypothetical protein